LVTRTRANGSRHSFPYFNLTSRILAPGQGEFAIQDSATKRDVDLSLPWESCFSPGQQVEMSMVFDSVEAFGSGCPKCNEDNDDDLIVDQDVEWFVLKSIYVVT